MTSENKGSTMTNIDYWLWLSLKKSMTAEKMQSLFSVFSSPEEIYNAKKEDFQKIKGITKRTANLLCDKSLERVKEVRRLCKEYNIKVLTFDSPYYPNNLRNIPAPPYVLYTRSFKRINLNEHIRIAIVGNRESTSYGENITKDFAYNLANNGIVIVSGMARGIDASAHRASLSAGGITVAVMGCGLDRAYPPQHKELMAQIIETGIAISEYPPKSKPERHHFPERNRIISGLSHGVLVTEAPHHSGSLITANYAIDQGRDLFSVPGDIDREHSVGTNNLLKDNATPVTSARDIFDYYSIETYEITKIKTLRKENSLSDYSEYKETKIEKDNKKEKPTIPDDFTSGLNDEEKQIISVLSHDAISFENLMNLSGISPDKLVSLITMLEIKGKIKTHPGKNFTLNL